MNLQNLLWLMPLLPLLGAAVLGGLALAHAHKDSGPSEILAGVLGVAFPAMAFLLVVIVAAGMPIGTGLHQVVAPWIEGADFKVSFGFLFDDLSRIMLLFITGIGTLITLYSVGYMHGDRGFARFMAYLNLFLFSMVTLVLADNLVLTFLGWEGVGLCSYLLIGFWHREAANGAAANKAFLVNRAGDLGFLLGIFCLIMLAGSAGISYIDLKNWLHDAANAQLIAGQGAALITLGAFLLFWGCTAKSAQIPLLTWLPDAMAGPTPVSALIHAATMVTSGVYLVVRLSDLFVLAPAVMAVIAVVGLGTAMWAAFAGLFQDDIKKVLAYSTISQLGFMFLAAGVGAFDAAIFHVFTHAFFKAALFLGAGSVIHALAGEQDIRKMGGLVKDVPQTFLIIVCGWVSIIGIPGTAGFWSKDLILEKVYVSSPAGPVLYVLALLTAVMTAVYMTRLMVLTFLGAYRGDKHTLQHAHESPLTMRLPMWILAAGSICAGFLWAGLIPGADLFERALHSVVGQAQETLGGEHEGPATWIFGLAGTCAAIFGAGTAWLTFTRRIPSTKGEPGPHGHGKSWTFIFDTLHSAFVLYPYRACTWLASNLVQKTFEAMQAIAGFGAVDAGRCFRKTLQPGSVRIQLGLGISIALLIMVSVFGRVF